MIPLRISGVFVLIWLTAFAVLPAAAAAELTLGLKEALALALTENPQIRAQGHSLGAAREDVGIARSYLLPKITAEERFMRTDNPAYTFSIKMNQKRFSAEDLAGAPDTFNNPEPISDFQTSVSLEQAIFAPKANIGLDMSKKEAAASERDFGRKQDEVAFNVFKTYLGVKTARAHVEASGRGIEDAEEHLRVAGVRYKDGLGVYSDVLRAKVAVAAAKERNIAARRSLETARRALGLMLGMAESIDIDPGEDQGGAGYPEVRPVEYYYEASLSRQDLKAMEHRVENAANTLRMADSGYLPVIGIGGSLQANDHSRPLGTEGDSWQVMAFLRWELFDGTRREHERKKAKYKISEAGEYLNGMKKEIAFQVYDAYLGVGEARDGLELSRTSFQSSEEGMRIVNLRYKNSLASMLELMDMQTTLDVSRAAVVEKESAYLSAVANLWFQSGVILRELGVERQ